ncbi:MAG: MMPL family transporter [Actinomycetota bacterium]
MKLDLLARFCYRNRWLVVALWIGALAGVVAGARFFGGEISNNVSLPGTESQQVIDLLEEKFPEISGDQASIAFKAAGGVTDPAVKRRMDAVFADFRKYEHVLSVTDPYDPRAPRISRTGEIGYATVQFDVSGPELPKAQIEEMGRRVEEANRPGLQVELGGESIRFGEIEGPGEREGVGLVAAIVILLIAFGSVVAMGLPIVTAIFGLGIGLSLITILANVMDLNVFAPQVASMIGLGVGIDYALFIVTRFREALRGGESVEDSVAIATSTSGRAVLFAGVTVIISLLAMFLTRIPFIYGFAVAPAVTVLVIMIVSITLLPAILSLAGRGIDRLSIPGLGRHTEKQNTMAYRWSRAVQRRPWVAAGAGTMALLLLAVPVLSLRMGWAGAGSNPESRTTRRAYDLLAEGFGPGFNEPLIAVAEFPEGRSQTLGLIAGAVQQTPGVAVVAPPQLSRRGDAAVIPIISATAPDDQRTEDLIVRLREEVLPAATGGTGARVFLGGVTPAFFDMSEILTARLPVLIVGVILLSFILLMAVFRSLLVPVKAALMNLLSIGAAYGVMVAVFQWGWLGGFFDIGRPGPIESFAPMMLFAILFGLSLDY